MKSIQNVAGFLFTAAVAALSAVSILGVWKFFSDDTIFKSFETIGVLAVVAVVIMVAGRLMDRSETTAPVPNPGFKIIRHFTLTVLVVCVSALALLGVLAIWDVVADKDILYRSLTSIGILAFGAFVITLTCLERENSPLLHGDSNSSSKGWTIGSIAGIVLVLYVLFSFFGMVF